MSGNHSPAVLRNKGIHVTIRETEKGEDGQWTVKRDAEGEPVTTGAWIRFDGNALADLEEAYGDLQSFQIASGMNPHSTVRRTLSLVLGWDDDHPRGPTGRPDGSGKACDGCRRAGLAMREGTGEYSIAIGAALAMANGLDPTQVVRLIEQGERAERTREEARDLALDELLASAAEDPSKSTGMNGSDAGSPPVVATTSSGA